MTTLRDVVRGVTAAAAALTASVGAAAAGLVLLDAGRAGDVGRMTAAVVALAFGGSADVSAVAAEGLPVSVRGSLAVVPSGVALVGAAVLGWLLLRHRDGLLVGSAAAAVTFPAGAAAVALWARGRVAPPGGALGGGSGVCGLPADGLLGRGRAVGALGADFSVSAWPVAAGAACWGLAVIGLCWLAVRFRITRIGPLWTALGLVVVGVLLAALLGGPAAAGGVLLLFPLVLVALVPWTVSTDGALACVLDGAAPAAPGGLLVWAAVVVAGVVVALSAGRSDRPWRRAALAGAGTGVALGVLAWLSRVSVRLGVDAFGFSVPVLDVSAAVNPLAALVSGSAAGAVAVLLADGVLRLVSVGSPAWNNRVG
ncbi:hypothetical protein [Lentzea sp. NPDC092896]|uniref:hypothetical protein n=1 Tax=Lentzea sp. NPDC092896 TaxID=3364127 RepID=UPI0037F92CF0